MAKHLIKLSSIVDRMEPVGSSMSTKYSYDGDMLRVYSKSGVVSVSANIGDSYIVNCLDWFVEVYPYSKPKNIFKVLYKIFNNKVVICHNYEDMLSSINYQLSGYKEDYKHSKGLYLRDTIFIKDKLEYREYYQAEGVIHSYLYISRDLTVKELKQNLVGYKDSDYSSGLPDKDITVFKYMNYYR